MHRHAPIAVTLALLAALAALAAFVSRLAAEAPAAEVTATTSAAPTPAAAGTAFLAGLGNREPEPAIEIALTGDQQLIADSALRGVMEFYLLERVDEGRLAALVTYLNRKLPPAAAREAVQLATHYRDYLAAHEELLAAQNFHAEPDTTRLASWQQQRRQLRARMLGDRVAEEWFGTEEAYLTQALEELNQPANAAPLNAAELRHQQHMRQVLRQATQSANR
jgi:hypothetical protein